MTDKMCSNHRGHCDHVVVVDGQRLVCTGLGNHPGYCHAYEPNGTRHQFGTKER